MPPLVQAERPPMQPTRRGEVAPAPIGAANMEWGPGPRPSLRFWLAVLAAGVLSLPFCWLLSFAALLPFYLGLFFFALFGLPIGALVFRISSPGGPYRPSTVVAGTTVLVLGVWSVSIIKESRDLPWDMAEKAIKITPDLDGRTPQQFRNNVASEVRAHIGTNFPPGGVLGYVRWALSGGTLKKGELASVDASMTFSQTRYIFAIRMALSVGLLAFGVASQTWPLRYVHGRKNN